MFSSEREAVIQVKADQMGLAEQTLLTDSEKGVTGTSELCGEPTPALLSLEHTCSTNHLAAILRLELGKTRTRRISIEEFAADDLHGNQKTGFLSLMFSRRNGGIDYSPGWRKRHTISVGDEFAVGGMLPEFEGVLPKEGRLLALNCSPMSIADVYSALEMSRTRGVLEEGGSLKVKGFFDDLVYVEYTQSGHPCGSEELLLAPDGMRFLIPVDRLLDLDRAFYKRQFQRSELRGLIAKLADSGRERASYVLNSTTQKFELPIMNLEPIGCGDQEYYLRDFGVLDRIRLHYGDRLELLESIHKSGLYRVTDSRELKSGALVFIPSRELKELPERGSLLSEALGFEYNGDYWHRKLTLKKTSK